MKRLDRFYNWVVLRLAPGYFGLRGFAFRASAVTILRGRHIEYEI